MIFNINHFFSIFFNFSRKLVIRSWFSLISFICSLRFFICSFWSTSCLYQSSIYLFLMAKSDLLCKTFIEHYLYLSLNSFCQRLISFFFSSSSYLNYFLYSWSFSAYLAYKFASSSLRTSISKLIMSISDYWLIWNYFAEQSSALFFFNIYWLSAIFLSKSLVRFLYYSSLF